MLQMFVGELFMSITKSTSSSQKSPIIQLWRCYLSQVSSSWLKYRKIRTAKILQRSSSTFCLYSEHAFYNVVVIITRWQQLQMACKSAFSSVYKTKPSLPPRSSPFSFFSACLQFSSCGPCVTSQIGFNCSWCSRLQRYTGQHIHSTKCIWIENGLVKSASEPRSALKYTWW